MNLKVIKVEDIEPGQTLVTTGNGWTVGVYAITTVVSAADGKNVVVGFAGETPDQTLNVRGSVLVAA